MVSIGFKSSSDHYLHIDFLHTFQIQLQHAKYFCDVRKKLLFIYDSLMAAPLNEVKRITKHI